MDRHEVPGWNRRAFLGGLALGGAAALLGLQPRRAGAEPPPEVARLRLFQGRGICIAPQYVVKELLWAEGFTDVQYIRPQEGPGKPSSWPPARWISIPTLPRRSWFSSTQATRSWS